MIQTKIKINLNVSFNQRESERNIRSCNQAQFDTWYWTFVNNFKILYNPEKKFIYGQNFTTQRAKSFIY